MGKLHIPNSVSLRNFDNLFRNNDYDFSDGKVELSFHPSYVAMAPVGLAFYAAIGDLINKNGWEKSAVMNYQIKSIPYLQRMGLFGCMGFADIRETEKHDETGRFIPLTKIRTGEELSQFIKSIDPILHTTRDNSRAIKHVFAEVLRNVLEHSNSPYGGNVCATYNKRRQKISIGISDIGDGLNKSLSRNHRIKDDKEAIKLALTPGISGVTKKIGGNSENAGAGLFFTKCIAQATRNHFLIYSGSSYYKLRYSKNKKIEKFNPNPFDDLCTVKSSLPYFPGTVVGIDIHINDDKAFNNLIENIGNAYQLSVKKDQKDYYKNIKFT
jgi:anti-sigma regulatory factor (Ser/Thr protein kinase)